MLLLPLRTDRPRIRFPYLTVALIVLNVLAHGFGMLAPGGGPAEPLGSRLIDQYGLRGSEPDALAFLTHMFVHTNVLHLAGNMLFLWIFGSLIEDAIRPWGMALLYLGGGIAAAAAHIGLTLSLGRSVDAPLVGASGAVAAVMGLFMLRFYRTRVEIGCLRSAGRLRLRWGSFWLSSVWALLYWIGVEVLSGVLDARLLPGVGVAHWAHVGGFTAGALAAPLVGGIAAARQEYLTDDPAANVERLRRREQAEAAERALRSDPANADLMRRAARSHRRAGNAPRAGELYRCCVERLADRDEAERAAEVYLELVCYDSALETGPGALFPVARALETGNPEQAAAAYRLLARRHPTHPSADRALLRLAALYQDRLEQPSEALHCLNEILRRYPHGPAAAQASRMKSNWMRDA